MSYTHLLSSFHILYYLNESNLESVSSIDFFYGHFHFQSQGFVNTLQEQCGNNHGQGKHYDGFYNAKDEQFRRFLDSQHPLQLYSEIQA